MVVIFLIIKYLEIFSPQTKNLKNFAKKFEQGGDVDFLQELLRVAGFDINTVKGRKAQEIFNADVKRYEDMVLNEGTFTFYPNISSKPYNISDPEFDTVATLPAST